MKLSDYVAQFLVEQNIKHVFAVAGGACLHLIDSIGATEGIDYICPHHEQAGAMAADAYARVTGNLGAAVSTSGPGATNMITGICCAYYDSVPVLFITGQVATFRLKRDTGVRQFGFQETEIVEMCKPITKYSVLVEDPKRIRYELEKAVYIAKTGRPGPVLVDIPDNLQREQIDPKTLEAYTPPPDTRDISKVRASAKKAVEMLRSSQRPILIYGWGIRLAGADEISRDVLKSSGVPVIPTWGALDLMNGNMRNFVGTFGLHGTRYGNFAVQNADLIISVGTRLDTHETGSPLNSFGREAKKVIVDIDGSELQKFEKFGLTSDLLVEADARDFLEAFLSELKQVQLPDIAPWYKTIDSWKEQFSICPPAYHASTSVNPYVFVKALSKHSNADETVVIDTGCAVAWFMQAFEPKVGQRLFSALNNTPMGYALPAAVGASLAQGNKSVVCLIGDGGIMMNLQELSTVAHHKLPIKIFVVNNHGYSMIQQTQDQWLGSRYHASSGEGGLQFPDFVKTAEAHGIKARRVSLNQDIDAVIKEVMASPGPVLCDVDINSIERVIPQVVFGRPIEDSGPLLDRQVFLKNMIVKPMDVSLKN